MLSYFFGQAFLLVGHNEYPWMMFRSKYFKPKRSVPQKGPPTERGQLNSSISTHKKTISPTAATLSTVNPGTTGETRSYSTTHQHGNTETLPKKTTARQTERVVTTKTILTFPTRRHTSKKTKKPEKRTTRHSAKTYHTRRNKQFKSKSSRIHTDHCFIILGASAAMINHLKYISLFMLAW